MTLRILDWEVWTNLDFWIWLYLAMKLISDIACLAAIGKSDYAVIPFGLNATCLMREKVSIVRDKNNYFKADYVKIREDLDIDWHAEFQGLSVSKGWLLSRKNV